MKPCEHGHYYVCKTCGIVQDEHAIIVDEMGDNPAPIEADKELREILGDETWKYTDIPHKLLAWRDKAVVAELEDIVSGKTMVINDRLKQLKAIMEIKE